MSVKQMVLVWEYSIQKGSPLLLLLSIADNAHENGFAFPGIRLLARKTRLSPRQVIRLIKSIEDTGELIVDKTKKFNRYVVNVIPPEGLDFTTCVSCGIRAFPELDLDLQWHHIIPTQEGGTEEPENLELLCVLCHANRHKGKARTLILSKFLGDNLSLINKIREKQTGDSQGPTGDSQGPIGDIVASPESFNPLNKKLKEKKESFKPLPFELDPDLNSNLDLVKAQLKEGMGLATYDAMIYPVLPLSKKNHTLTLVVKDIHHQAWLEQRVITKKGYLNIFRGIFDDINLRIKLVLLEDVIK